MVLTYTPGGDLTTGGSFLSEPGSYHLVVTDVTEHPTKKDGSLIDNAMFKASLSVLDGTTPHQSDKSTDLIFFHPKPDATEGGKKLAKKKLDRFFLSTGLATREQLEKGDQLDISLDNCVGRQIVAKFEMSDYGDKPQLQLSYAEIYHVDDPEVKAVPKKADALKLIEAALRWPGGRPAAKAETLKKEAVKSPATNADEFGDL